MTGLSARQSLAGRSVAEMAISDAKIVRETTDDFLNRLKSNPPGPNFNRLAVAENLFNQTVTAIAAYNTTVSKLERIPPPKRLYNFQIASLILALEPVCFISCGKIGEKSENYLLGVYQSSGPNEGIYDTSDRALDQIIRQYNTLATPRDKAEIRDILCESLPVKNRCMDRDLIAVNNGIFDYKTKTLLPFDPNKIFLSKSRVNYNPNAQNITIHNPDDNTDWDVESWMSELSNDPAIVILLWEILGAIIRPNVRWDKSAWLYATSGNNGKGTLCELMRNLCGEGNYASISLSDFAKDFHLESLIHANAIIVDENDVGIYLDKVANLKAVITNDVVLINRKFKSPISYQFLGFSVQCLNEFPRIKDTSDSFYRRQLFIPFGKCFTGRARKYIKDDYLNHKEVLEYVMFKVLNMNYYELSEPEACKAILADYKEFNNPIQSFIEEILPETKWNLLPFGFLYALFMAWYEQNNPSGKVQGKNTFIKEITDMAVAGKIPGFTCLGRKHPVRPKHLMDDPEFLISEYNLVKWMNPDYRGNDQRQICMPAKKSTYSGLIRIGYEDEATEDEAALPPSAAQMDTTLQQVVTGIEKENGGEEKIA